MTNQKKILLVEDDENLGFVIQDNLTEAGYQVTWCQNGEQGENSFVESSFNICILDVMLPKKDGFALASAIRQINIEVPILFLTAKSMQEDKIEGFRKGGDDYITKPFSMEELLLRINVFLKRSGSSSAQNTLFKIGVYTFDSNNLVLTNGKSVKKLTQKESEILKLFCEKKNEVLKREVILNRVWGDDDYFLGRSMDVFISKLRKYLKDDPQIEIINYHGVGFQFSIKESDSSNI